MSIYIERRIKHDRNNTYETIKNKSYFGRTVSAVSISTRFCRIFTPELVRSKRKIYRKLQNKKNNNKI